MLIQNYICDLLDGCVLLEYLGNLYEYIGSENGMYLFQDVNDDHWIKIDYEKLRTMSEYCIRYPENSGGCDSRF